MSRENRSTSADRSNELQAEPQRRDLQLRLSVSDWYDMPSYELEEISSRRPYGKN